MSTQHVQTVPPTAPSEPGTPMLSRMVEALGGKYRSIPVLLVLGLIWLYFYSQNSAFLTSGNITTLTLQIVTTAILALGVVFVLLVGEIDLSSAMLSGVCATVTAQLAIKSEWPLWLAILGGVAVGVVFVLAEVLAVIFGVPSLIVTLGGMVILQGLLLVVLPPEFAINVAGTDYARISSTYLPPGWSLALGAVGWLIFCATRYLGHRERGSDADSSALLSVGVPAVVSGVVIFGAVAILSEGPGLPLPVLILVGMLLIAAYFTGRTRYGTHLYAVGGNREAAQRAGIPVSRMVVYSFLVLGVCAAVAGMVEASRLLAVSNSSGGGPLMLNAIAAAVVGGVSLFGGRGTVWAALLGALVIGSINNGVQLLGMSTEVQSFATGGVLILAVAIDVVITRGSLLPNRR
ncbi:sugar ABC transporter permease [Nocardioides carbamazepini]|uniref:sugar ABC transporter permease n=1 Tax=Nocardioides carbamazepini TaxID=2854259 RepID=UPI002149A886|nr:sugar ABC transporter permease [Nocardioides carbamazepini]MCR1784568.1 sugar ABC transporter permease [Nocardioides carbamazepini]